MKSENNYFLIKSAIWIGKFLNKFTFYYDFYNMLHISVIEIFFVWFYQLKLSVPVDWRILKINCKCDVKHIMKLLIKTIILKVLTYCYSSDNVCLNINNYHYIIYICILRSNIYILIFYLLILQPEAEIKNTPVEIFYQELFPNLPQYMVYIRIKCCIVWYKLYI
jgi:hypothetical protein